MFYYRKLPSFRFFNVENDTIPIKEGDFKVFSLDGETYYLQEEALTNFEISTEEAQSYLFNSWINQQQAANQQLQEFCTFLEMTEADLDIKKEIVKKQQKMLASQQQILQSIQSELSKARIQQATKEIEKFKDSNMLEKTAQHLIEQLKNNQSQAAKNFDPEKLKDVLKTFFEQKPKG